MDKILIGLASGLIGSIIGGLIAVIGAILSVRKLEEFRRSERLRNLLRTALSKVEHTNNILTVINSLIMDAEIDNAVFDYIGIIISPIRRNRFRCAWDKYRYDPKHYPNMPFEYSKNPDSTKDLIKQRLHNLISLLK
jgi:hypothetical protein